MIQTPQELPFFSGIGEIRSLLCQLDWSTSPLGHPQTWPQELVTIVNLMLDSPFPMVVTWGPELGFLYNDAYAIIMGEKHPGSLGQRFQDIWSEIWPSISPIVDDALAGKPSYFEDLPLTVLRKGYPEQAWFTFSYSPVRDSSGRIAGMYCVAIETTQRVQSEKRQAFQLELSDRLRGLSAPEDVIATASKLLGRHLGVQRVYYADIDDLNKRFFVRGKWIDGDLPPLPETGLMEDYGPVLVDILRSGKEFIVDDVNEDERTARHAHAYAALHIRSIMVVPLVKGGRLAITLNLSNSAPYRWTQEDIAVAREMAERTWAAAENAQAQFELRQADRRKDEFLAMLAHELRNPLAPISAAAELMEMAPLDEARLRQTSRVIGRQVSHMTGLVDDLLDVSRVNRGLVSISKTPQDLKSIVSNAVEQVRPLIEAQRHHLGIDLAPEPALVLGDQKRLVQILTNLLNNAAKYTPPGGNIHLHMEVHDEQVILSVADNGIGIAPDLQAHIFELFTQAERSSDRAQGGLGLGLALVKSLAELHGGSVTCFSEGLGKGSQFTVYLPRGTQLEQAPERRRKSRTIAKAPRALRILIVDDNADAAQMLAMLLETSGHHVLVEHRPHAALERARIEESDVCLLDIGLPDMDGYELARRLRAQPETARAVLIAITGYGQEHDRANALAAGFDYHLVKPVDAARLGALLVQLADQ